MEVNYHLRGCALRLSHADMLMPMLVQPSPATAAAAARSCRGSMDQIMQRLHACITCTYTCMPYDGSTRTQHDHGHRTMMLMTACTKDRDRSPLPCLALPCALHMSDRQGNVGKVGSFRPVSNKRERGGEAYVHVCALHVNCGDCDR